MTRALKFAKAKLQKAGIHVVDWEPYKWKEMGQLVVSCPLTRSRPSPPPTPYPLLRDESD